MQYHQRTGKASFVCGAVVGGHSRKPERFMGLGLSVIDKLFCSLGFRQTTRNLQKHNL